MTKRKPKTKPAVSKPAAAKTSATKRSPEPAANGVILFVLGFDDQQKPRGARFDEDNPELVAKAAGLMGFKVYRTASEDVVAAAKRLPIGKLYANGRGMVPSIRQDLYTDIIVELVADPPAPLPGTNPDTDSVPEARGLPRSWDEIGPGHLVIAHESLEQGWWEAIVVERKNETFTLRYRDFPHLPKFARHQSAVALMYPSDGDRQTDAKAEQA
jgi:hypothetical protein